MSERAGTAPSGSVGAEPGTQLAATRLDAQVRATPHAVALVASERTLTYAQFDAAVDVAAAALADGLAAAGARTVGLALDRTADLAVLTWACLRLGVTYVPLDPGYPAARLAHMVRDAGAGLLVADDVGEVALGPVALGSADAGPDHAGPVDLPRLRPPGPDAAPVPRRTAHPAGGRAAEVSPRTITPDALAYVIYTSGSTGRPKGVQVEQRNLAHFLDAMGAAVQPARRGRGVFLASTTLSFDPSVVELIWALTAGMTVVLAPSFAAPAARRASLGTLIERHGVTHVQLTPSRARVLLADDGERRALAGLEQMFVGGEVLSAELAADLLDAGVGVVTNLYGPTESTVWAFAHDVVGRGSALRGGRPVPIGAPLPGYTYRVLAADGGDVAEGAVGELLVGGGGVTAGYRDRPELDGERFVVDEVLGRAYRTGDLVRRDGGVLAFVGRADDQVKVDGHRIELAEVEAGLAGTPGVAQVVVAAKGAPPRLVAYVLPDPRTEPVERGELLARLREHGENLLTHPMLPTDVVVVDAFELTPSGKVDRSRLADPTPPAGDDGDGGPAPDAADGDADRPAPAPDAVRDALAAWWAELLGRRRVRVDEDFFDLGGDSTLAVRLLARVQRTWGVRLGLATLVSASTVAALADVVVAAAAGRGTGARSAHLVPFHPQGAGGRGRRPLVVVHGAGGNVLNLTPMARHLSESRPVIGVQARGVDGTSAPDPSIDAMADRYVAELVAAHPHGPYLLAGYSGGGLVAIEMARRLQARRERVPVVLLFDSYPPGTDQPTLGGKLWNVVRNVRHHGAGAVARSLRVIARRRLAGEVVPGARELGYGDVSVLGLHEVDGHFNRVAGVHRCAPVAVRAVLFRADIIQASLPPTRDWSGLLSAPPEELVVPGHHYSMFDPAHAGALAAAVEAVLERWDPA